MKSTSEASATEEAVTPGAVYPLSNVVTLLDGYGSGIWDATDDKADDSTDRHSSYSRHILLNMAMNDWIRLNCYSKLSVCLCNLFNSCLCLSSELGYSSFFATPSPPSYQSVNIELWTYKILHPHIFKIKQRFPSSLMTTPDLRCNPLPLTPPKFKVKHLCMATIAHFVWYVETGPDPTQPDQAYFWHAENKRSTCIWPGYFLTWLEEIFFDPKGKKLENLMFLGEIFQTQTMNGWPDPDQIFFTRTHHYGIPSTERNCPVTKKGKVFQIMGYRGKAKENFFQNLKVFLEKKFWHLHFSTCVVLILSQFLKWPSTLSWFFQLTIFISTFLLNSHINAS